MNIKVEVRNQGQWKANEYQSGGKKSRSLSGKKYSHQLQLYYLSGFCTCSKTTVKLSSIHFEIIYHFEDSIELGRL
jgi:hypothetical protein